MDVWSVIAWVAALCLGGAAGYWWARRGAARPSAMTAPQGSETVTELQAVRAALQALPDACIVVDAMGRVVLRNDAASELTAASEGKPLAASFRVPAVLQAIERVLDGGPAEDAEFVLPVPVERTIEAHIAPLAVGAGPMAMVFLYDTTLVTRVERMRADFVANASHELRTPLTSLAGFIETIRGPAKDDKEAQERFLEIMQEQAARMKRLIEDLLSLSRIEMNEHVRPSGKADLAAIAHDVVDAAQPMLARAGVKVAIEVERGAGAVVGERDDLVQLVQNLLDNAVRYGASGGPITIRIARSGEMTSCSVIDRGPGIAREHIPRLTERFYRVDAKTSRERGGTGLGLAIVKHILNRHRGRLEIESEVGKGAQFTFLLPSWTAPAAA
jgi:two-component system phosphate regulon sensor histidine kinase PhoR